MVTGWAGLEVGGTAVGWVLEPTVGGAATGVGAGVGAAQAARTKESMTVKARNDERFTLELLSLDLHENGLSE